MSKALTIPQAFIKFFDSLDGPGDGRVVAVDLTPSWLGVQIAARGRRVPLAANSVRVDLGRHWLHSMSTRGQLHDCLSCEDQRANLEQLMRAVMASFDYRDNVIFGGHVAVPLADAQRILRSGMSREVTKRKSYRSEREKEYRRIAYGYGG